VRDCWTVTSSVEVSTFADGILKRRSELIELSNNCWVVMMSPCFSYTLAKEKRPLALIVE
jgi:hypothetical protein